MSTRPSVSPKTKESAEVAASRIKKIQDHFASAPGSGKLTGKVAIITGVGSLKGIGRAAAFAYAREGLLYSFGSHHGF